MIVFKTGTDYKAIQSGNFPGNEYISPFMLSIWQSQWAQQDDLPDFVWQSWAQMVKGLHEAGVPLMVGTEVPVRFIGLEDRFGTVTAGKSASLVLVKGNPLEDIRNAQLIEPVFQRGIYYNRMRRHRR